MTKKCLSLILVLSMVLQLCCMVPTLAEETEIVRTYFINDDFNVSGDLGNWKYVYGDQSGKTITFKQTTMEDETGVMEFGADRWSSQSGEASPTISNDFEDIDLDTNKIVIETRYKSNGDGTNKNGETGSLNWLRFNMPEDVALATDRTVNDKTISYFGSKTGVLLSYGSSGVGYKSGAYATTVHDATLTSGQWVNAKIVIDNTDGTVSDYTLTTWKDNDETNAVTVTGTMLENGNYYYNPELYMDDDTTNDQTRHKTFQNLLFSMCQYSDTMYIDYVKGYTEKEIKYVNATAKLQGGMLIDTTDAVKVKFTSDSAITSIPEAAVTIDGVEATASFDADTQVYTLTPETALTPGQIYTVSLDKELLKSAYITLKGQSSLKLQVKGYGINYFIDDNFDSDGDLGNWKYVYGDRNSDNSSKNITFKQTTMEDGTGVMEFSADSWSSQSGQASPTISSDFADIDLDTNKIVIETRYKSLGGGTNKSGATGAMNLFKFNQPEDVALATDRNVKGTEISYFGKKAGVLVQYGSSGLGYKSSSWGAETFDSTLTAGQWVNAKIVIDNTDGTKNDYTLTTWKDNDEANAVNTTGTLLTDSNYYYNPELFIDEDTSNDYTRYKSLDNLLFSICQYSDTMYVDYIKGYAESKPEFSMSASVKYPLIDDDDSILINIETDDEITAIPEGMFTIDGVTLTESYDADTKTLTLTPVDVLDKKTDYTINVNSDGLYGAGIEYTGEDTLTFSTTGYGINYYINDDFNTEGDLGNWKYVYGDQSGKNITFKQTTMDDGTGVMEFGADRWSSQSGEASPTISNDFADIDLDTNKIVIETRYKSNGGGTMKDGSTGALNWLRFNMPEDVSIITDKVIDGKSCSYIGSKTGVLLQYGASGVGYKTGAYQTTVHDATLTAGQWVNAKIVIDNTDGVNYDYTVTTWKDGSETEAITVTGVIIENGNYFYDPELFLDEDPENDLTRHKEFKNLLFSICQYSDTMYIDYIKCYTEVAPENDMSATLANGLINKNDAVVINLETETEISKLPNGVFTIDGVETNAVFDAEAMTVTLTPVEELAEKVTYTINVNEALLWEAGINYTGETLTFKTIGKGYNYFVNDDFNTAGDLGNWKYVYGNQDGKNITFKQTTMEDGTGVMEFGADRWSSQSGEASPTISNDFADIDLDTNKIVIETRYKSNGGGTNKNGATGAQNWLRFNMPEDLAFVTDKNYDNGFKMSYFGSKTGVLLQYGASGVAYKSSAYQTTVHDATLTAGQWVNAKIVIDNTDGINYDYTVTTWKDGNEKDAITVTGMIIENGDYYYNPELYLDDDPENDQKRHKTLQNLLFSICQYSDTMYIDYVKAAIVVDSVEGEAKLTVDGEEIEEITAGTTVKPVFTINPEVGVTDYTVISALYIDGILEDTHINPLTVTENEFVYTEEDGWVIPSALEGKYTIKAFIWNTLEGMKPVSTVTQAQSAAND